VNTRKRQEKFPELTKGDMASESLDRVLEKRGPEVQKRGCATTKEGQGALQFEQYGGGKSATLRTSSLEKKSVTVKKKDSRVHSSEESKYTVKEGKGMGNIYKD